MPDALSARMKSIAIEVTSKCNLRCAYCPKADPEWDALPYVNTDMSDDMLHSLHDFCRTNEIKFVTLSGTGETTFFRDWHRRLAVFLDDPAIDLHLVSNFARPFADGDLDALCKFKYLQVSFDSADAVTVRTLRSKTDLRTVVYNIVRLNQRSRELGRRPYLTVYCTLCRDNIGHIASLASLCRELAVDQLLIGEMVVMTPHNPFRSLDELTSDEVNPCARNIVEAERIVEGCKTILVLQQHLELRFGDLLGRARNGDSPSDSARTFHRHLASSACMQPWTTPFIRSDGKVFACCITNERIAPVGDLASEPLEMLLDGQRYRAVRQSILEGRPVLPCAGCHLALKQTFQEFASTFEPEGACQKDVARTR
jgi:MoaA/NifB/PqqE/SkfB family radical SAM enzyme